MRRLRGPRGDGDVVEEAEPHLPAAQGVVARRAHEREHAQPGGLDRRSGREQGRLVRGAGADRVRVEPDRLLDLADPLDVPGRVAALEVLAQRGQRLLGREPLEERQQPLGRLGMPEGRVQPRQRRMRQAVDRRTASASSSRLWPAPAARPTR